MFWNLLQQKKCDESSSILGNSRRRIVELHFLWPISCRNPNTFDVIFIHEIVIQDSALKYVIALLHLLLCMCVCLYSQIFIENRNQRIIFDRFTIQMFEFFFTVVADRQITDTIAIIQNGALIQLILSHCLNHAIQNEHSNIVFILKKCVLLFLEHTQTHIYFIYILKLQRKFNLQTRARIHTHTSFWSKWSSNEKFLAKMQTTKEKWSHLWKKILS